MQTKKQSFIEASTNTAIGFIISYASTFVIFPLMGFASSAGKNVIITLFFTVVSIFRGYVIRRVFNNKKNASKKQLLACVCNDEDKHGQTTVWCCNECGKPTEDFWLK